MTHRSLVLANSPAVLVFDPATGRLASQNAAASELLATLHCAAGECPTLSTIERLITAGGRTVALPNVAGASGDMNYELRRRCRRPDGSELALTRIWAPGANTILIVADITKSVQGERQLRFAQAVIDRLMKSETVGQALDTLLHMISRYAGWSYAEAWLLSSGRLIQKKTHHRPGEFSSTLAWTVTELPSLTSEGSKGGIVGEAWRSGEIRYLANIADVETVTRSARIGATDAGIGGFVAVPLKANDEVIAVLMFGFERARARDRLSLEILEGASDRLGMALQCRINAEEATSARRQVDELLATAGDAIVATDSSHKIRIFNKRAEHIFGYSPEEVIGQNLDMLLPASAHVRHRAHLARFGKGEEATKLMGRRPEVRGRRKDGSEFPAEASVSRTIIDNEMIYTAVVRDLTVLRQAEEALHARERQMRMIVEAMPFGLAITRRIDGEILFANGAFSALLQMNTPDLSGRRIGDFLDMDLVDQLSGGPSADGKVEGVEALVRTDAGSSIWCTLSAVAMSMAGESVTLIGCYDITDRRRAIDALRESAHSLAEAERIAHLGHWRLDIASGAINGSDEAWRIFGVEPNSANMSMSVCTRRIHPVDRMKFRSAVADAIRGGAASRLEHRIILPGGDIRFILTEAEAEYGPDDQVVGLIGTILDVTDMQRAADELRNARTRAELANRSKSQFLANMSHELRTPLNAIIGFSELMASDILGPMEVSRYRAYAKDINDSGNHLLAIVNDILDLSRIEVGATELDETLIDIGDLAHACIRIVEGRAVQTKLTLRHEVPSSLPRLLADARLVKQILLNLLSNAIKFTPPGGTIKLIAREKPEGGIAIQVEDSGIGIAQGDIERVMEPFVQVEGDLSRRFDGVGLGLALVKQFAQQHGAALGISSELGQGTCVHVHFPPTRTRIVMAPHMARRAANG